jgi:Tol biopolymer transport system component
MISSGAGRLRAVVVGGRAGVGATSWPPVFSADGTRLLIPYLPAHSADDRLQVAVADVGSGPARHLSTPCREPPLWSPDGLLIACTGPAFDHVSVADLLGRVRFTVPGSNALWSADGQLAVTNASRTTVVSARGVVTARLNGIAQTWSPDGHVLALVRPDALVLADPSRLGPVRIVIHRPDVLWAAFTPDGRDLAYAVSGDAHPRIAPVAGGPSRPLAGGVVEGTWSRDGRYAFSRVSGTTITLTVGDRFGRGARVVGRFPFDDHGMSSSAWLGDGSRLLFDDSTRDHADLWTMAADGSRQRRLTDTGRRISAPAWSADGRRLAYDSAPFKGGLCGYCGGGVVVADAHGRKLSLVPGSTPGAESGKGGAAWAPSGTRIAVSDDYNGGIYVVGLDGSGQAQIAPDASASPAWSPDGATVAYTDSFDGGAIWGVDPTGAVRRPLLPLSTLKARSVAWSTDGRLLALSTADGVYFAPADGSAAPQRVASARSPGRPTFSPDGTWLAFAAQTGGVYPYRAIYRVGVDGTGLRQLTAGPFDSADPAWRPQPPPQS